jgi:hypothetical protein
MLLVADHCSHFGPAALSKVLMTAGFEVLQVSNEWISKEITAVGRRPTADSTAAASDSIPRPAAARREAEVVLTGPKTLGRIVEQARALAGPGFGVFGTSIAATWLHAELGGAISFFVDEDPGRRGREHLGRPILAPEDVPADSRVLVALPAELAARVSARLSRRGVEYLVPAS